MNSALLAEFTREIWAMEPRALEWFIQTVARLDPSQTPPPSVLFDPALFATTTSQISDGTVRVNYAARDGMGPFDEAPRRTRLSVAEGVASIGISGVLLKRVPNIARWFGVEATSYGEIQQDLAQAMGDDNVKSVRLKIESPGGMVSGVKETADAIYQGATKKKITAEIQDLGASAAYWLASQAKEITANPNATVGSLGAYTAYADFSKAAEMEGIKVHVIASGPHKGMGIPGAPITEEQLKPVRDLINGIAGGFHADISRGRGMEKDKTNEWMTGQVWRAEEAAVLRIIDAVRSSNTETSSPGVPAAASVISEEVAMTTEEKAAADKANREAADKAHLERVKAIQGAFPDDPAFALAQIGLGATLADAKAAYADVVVVRNKELTAKLAEATKAKPAAARTGAEPLAAGGEPQTVQEPDFLAAAKAYAKENECSLEKAMSILSRGENGERNSKLFTKHVEHCMELGKAAGK